PLLGLGSVLCLLPDVSTWRSPSRVVCGLPRSESKSGPLGYWMRFPTCKRSTRVPQAAGPRDKGRHVPPELLLPLSVECRARSPPVSPVKATTYAPRARPASTPRMTLGLLPLVVSATRTSCFDTRASIWREKINSNP